MPPEMNSPILGELSWGFPQTSSGIVRNFQSWTDATNPEHRQSIELLTVSTKISGLLAPLTLVPLRGIRIAFSSASVCQEKQRK